jgi:feruloyl-CoA synthase
MNAPFRKVRYGPRDTELERRPDGSMIMRSPHPLESYPDKITERLVHWAKMTPDRTLVAQRGRGGSWIEVSYAVALDRVRAIGQALLDQGLSTERGVAIISDNSIEHLLLALAAQHVGIPFGPISSAYSLVSDDFGKLKHVLGLLTPGLVFAQNGSRFARALAAAVPADCEVVVVDDPPRGRKSTSFSELVKTRPTDDVDRAFERVGPDTVAKILFTSGSTGLPKGVINTQRMICANQQQKLQAFPFFGEDPPVLVDWLVWNHTFGGNHNVGIVLYNGGSLYIDDGKPTPAGIEKTVANLREIAPTIYFNVPKGFEELIPYLQRDPGVRRTFFSRLKMIMYAGAGLAQHVWDALEELAVATIGERIAITTGIGMTESGPSALFANWEGGFSGLLGVPVAGLELKLVPNEEKLEARYRGPNLTRGFWRQPELTNASFDDEGFYLTGDALKFVDPEDPRKGMLFDGRIAEDFKLSTGTWVSVGNLRAALVAAGAPYVQDCVIAGLNRDFLAAIIFPHVDTCRSLCSDLPEVAEAKEMLAHPAVREQMQRMLDTLARHSTGSATRIARALIATVPPSIDAGEITDKGSINQRAVLRNRPGDVEDLYADPAPSRVLIAAAKERGRAAL